MTDNSHPRLERIARRVPVPEFAYDRLLRRRDRKERNRRLSAAALAIVLTLLSVTALVRAFGNTVRPATGPTPSNVFTTPIPPGTGSMVDLRTGQVTPLPASIATSGTYYAVSPDRTRVAYNTCCNPPDPLYVANVDGTQVRQVTPVGRDAFGAQWSPDGSLIVYQQRDASTLKLGNLFVQNTRTGRRTRLTNFDQTQTWGWWFTFPSFAPDGRSILFQLPRGNQKDAIWDLWSVPVAGGKPTLVRRVAGFGGYSPGGRWLAYLQPVNAHDFTGRKLWITGVHGGTPRALVAKGHLGWLRWSPDGTRISYSNGGSIYVLEIATGSSTRVGAGGTAEWFDDHTLIVGPGSS
jgi:Tol biopolymer transport system component